MDQKEYTVMDLLAVIVEGKLLPADIILKCENEVVRNLASAMLQIRGYTITRAEKDALKLICHGQHRSNPLRMTDSVADLHARIAVLESSNGVAELSATRSALELTRIELAKAKVRINELENTLINAKATSLEDNSTNDEKELTG